MFKAITSAVKDGALEGTKKEIAENIAPKVLLGVGCFALGIMCGCHATNAKWTQIILMEVIKR